MTALTGVRPLIRSIALAVVAAMVLAFGSSGAARPATSAATPDWRSPVLVAARYVKTVDPSVKLSTNQLTTLLTDLRAGMESGAADVQATSNKGASVPMVSYWNNTYWFNHWDVAMMAGLSAVAIVAILLTTGPIGVGTAWGIVGAVMGVIATAFFSGYCAYYVTTQHRGGIYHC